MLSVTQYGSPTYTPNPPITAHRRRPPSSYPEGVYPSWIYYCACPPRRRRNNYFRNCNTTLDFSRSYTSDPQGPILLCHELHYVPRVFTWGWSAQELLITFKRLRRFLSANPISSIPEHAISIFLFYAKSQRIELGLLIWPQGYWNSEYTKDPADHELVQAMIKKQLEECIVDAQRGVTQAECRRRDMGLPEPMMSFNRFLTSYCYGTPVYGDESYNSSSPESSAEPETENTTRLPLTSQALKNIQAESSKAFDSSLRTVSQSSTQNWTASALASPTSDDGTSSSCSEEFDEELEERYRLDWIESIQIDQKTEGLGWLVAEKERQTWPAIDDEWKKLSDEMLASTLSDASSDEFFDEATNMRAAMVKPEPLGDFNFSISNDDDEDEDGGENEGDISLY